MTDNNVPDRINGFAIMCILPMALAFGFSGYALYVEHKEITGLRSELNDQLSTINLSIKESQSTVRDLNRDKSILINELAGCTDVRKNVDDRFFSIGEKLNKLLKDKKK